MIFLDTNIFLYVVSGSAGDEPKKRAAQSLIAEGRFGISVQVLQEFMHVTLRKKQLGLTQDEIAGMVSHMAGFPLVETTVLLARKAFDLSNRFQTSYWDAAILAAAQELGCHTLYSEDFNHGQDYDGVRVINPFL
jgi:predicted nucleic acid-binding protein